MISTSRDVVFCEMEFPFTLLSPIVTPSNSHGYSSTTPMITNSEDDLWFDTSLVSHMLDILVVSHLLWSQ